MERSLPFGDVYLALALWRALGFDRFCGEVMESGNEEVPWDKMAAVLVAARLCEPSSELHIAEDWYRRTALAGMNNKLFVSKYQVELPKRREIQKFLEEQLQEV